jgi:hypothetical protein
LIYHGDLFGVIGDWLADLINKWLHPLLRRKYPDEEIKRRYSEAIYHHFYENVSTMVVQLREYMVPALEHSFKESLKSLIEQMNANVNKIGERINKMIADIDSVIDGIQASIDFVVKN